MAQLSKNELGVPPSVSELVISRLPQYVRVLTDLHKQCIRVVNSYQLGDILQITPAQIRKDLSFFGKFGKQGQGYDVRRLIRKLKEILKLDRRWNVCVVGVGRLGNALLSYPGLAPEGFHIVAAFDLDSSIVGQRVNQVTVYDMVDLESIVQCNNISIGIVAVPAASVQSVVEQLIGCGILSILNYAPITPRVPNSIRISNVDPVISLQAMTYYIKG